MNNKTYTGFTSLETAVKAGKMHQKILNKKSRDLALVESAIKVLEPALAEAKTVFREEGTSQAYKEYTGMKNVYIRECMYRKKLRKEVKKQYCAMRLAKVYIYENDV